MTPICGFNRRKLPSLSSASATSHWPLPSRALAPAASRCPPITNGGAIPPSATTLAGREAVVEAHQSGQHLRTRPHRNALRARLHELGVVGLDRAGHDHAVDPEHV